jgi:hypothetical protein
MFLYWATCLVGLPDVGEPSGVTDPRPYAAPVRKDDNAYSLYLEAAARYDRGEADFHPMARFFGRGVVKIDEARIAAWLDGNRDALKLFLKGSDRPDAVRPAIDEHDPEGGRLAQTLRVLPFLAIEDAARHEAEGDMAGAWRDYRGVFRGARLMARRAAVWERLAAAVPRGAALKQVRAWADDPRTERELLRTALEDALALEQIPADDVVTIRTAYRQVARDVEQPESQYLRSKPWVRRFRPMPGAPDAALEMARWVDRALRVFQREPERSRRVTRLVFADWLAAASAPRPGPRAAVRVVVPDHFQSLSVDLYAVPPDAPAAARAMEPMHLARWLAETHDAANAVGSFVQWYRQARNRERADQAALVLLLAEALYRRDHGADPPRLESLVGPYLKALPDDGSNDLDDGTIPTVGEEIPPPESPAVSRAIQRSAGDDPGGGDQP